MKIENVKVYDLEESIKASKYPMSTDTDKCDSEITGRVKTLGACRTGTGHDNYLNGIRVAFDLTFTIKAWTEAERYHFFDFVSSMSTIHCLSKFDLKSQYNEYVDKRIVRIMEERREIYLQTKSKEDYLKLLYSNPCGFNLTARMTTNYRQLKTIYQQRENHTLPEWREFCKWVIELPYFKELTGLADVEH